MFTQCQAPPLRQRGAVLSPANPCIPRGILWGVGPRPHGDRFSPVSEWPVVSMRGHQPAPLRPPPPRPVTALRGRLAGCVRREEHADAGRLRFALPADWRGCAGLVIPHICAQHAQTPPQADPAHLISRCISARPAIPWVTVGSKPARESGHKKPPNRLPPAGGHFQTRDLTPCLRSQYPTMA